MTNTPTRHIVPAGADAAVRDALQAMVRAHETGRYEPLQAAYLHAKSTLGELAASPASGKVGEAEVEKAARAAFNSMPWEEYSNFDRQNYIHMIERALESLGLEVE